MKITVIRWKAYSDVLKRRIEIELAYPLRSYDQAIEMFIKEYPNAEIEHMRSFEFDSEDRPDYYKALEKSGCVRFWKTY